MRKRQLRAHPMCQCKKCKGKKLAANVVDHIIAHRGNERLFWDENNLQSMNKQCHDSDKQREEGGRTHQRGCDHNGSPLSPDHHWNTKERLH